MTDEFDKGDLVRCAAVFTNAAGTAVDPATVTFKVKRTRSGAVTTYVYGTDVQLIKDSTGNYHADVNASEPGSWYYRFESTGAGQAAEEGKFKVVRSAF